MWQVEHQCPQCGAPVILEETDRIFACAFCRVRLYIACGDYFRYSLSASVDDREDRDRLFYLPYWRFKGIAFSCTNHQIQHRVLDSSILAVNSNLFPRTLGFRSQVLKLKFISPNLPGEVIKPHFPFDACDMRLTNPVSGAVGGPGSGRRTSHEAFVGETVSLIHSPVSMRGELLVDAVLNKPLARASEGIAEQLVSFEGGDGSSMTMNFIPTLCPHCGWDLEGEKDASMLLCKNCQSAWEPSGGELKRAEFALVEGGSKSSIHLPFWRMRAKIAGLELDSYADLVRMANLPRVIRKGWDARALAFWFPAFKVHPQLFLRLAKALTIFQPAIELQKPFPPSMLHPVTLPAHEAASALKVTVAALAVPKRLIFPRLPEVSCTVDERLLVYLPFESSGKEFTRPEMQASISMNALKLGRNL